MDKDNNNKEQDQYRWTVETNEFISSSDTAWRERRATPLSAGVKRALPMQRKNKSKSLIPMSYTHTTKVLASLVPDEIIYNVNDYSHRYYDSCLLFGDVSGKNTK